jgi:hypothetical protein
MGAIESSNPGEMKPQTMVNNNGSTVDRRRDETSNNCGQQWINDMAADVPSLVVSDSKTTADHFTGCCNNLNTCSNTAGKSEEECSNEFQRCLERTVDTLLPGNLESLVGLADEMEVDVDIDTLADPDPNASMMTKVGIKNGKNMQWLQKKQHALKNHMKQHIVKMIKGKHQHLGKVDKAQKKSETQSTEPPK